MQLAKTEAFYGQHILVPRHGVAVHINAFNFPAWGFAEKAACALLAGMPVITKPATATALVTERCIELIVEAGILPEGALQLIVGSTGDLLDRLGPQDVLAFTGSADTARSLRSRDNLLAANTRVNVEADSLNAAVLGPDVAGRLGHLRPVPQGRGARDDPEDRPEVHGRAPHPGPQGPDRRGPGRPDLPAERGRGRQPGGPFGDAWARSPPPSSSRTRSRGIAELEQGARIVHGAGERADGVGAPEGKGFFVAPTLLRSDDARSAGPSTSGRSSARSRRSSPTTARPRKPPRSWPWAAARW